MTVYSEGRNVLKSHDITKKSQGSLTDFQKADQFLISSELN